MINLKFLFSVDPDFALDSSSVLPVVLCFHLSELRIATYKAK